MLQLFVSALILPFPDTTLPLADSTKFKSVGAESALTGFPSVADPMLCFFSGRISAFLVKSRLLPN